MTFAQQEEILLNIYSIDYLLKCRVDEYSGNILKLSPFSGKVDMFEICDPVVLVYYGGNNLETVPADVVDIDSQLKQVALFIRKKEIEEERRIYERYPVSLQISVRRKFSNKRLHFLVKNISLYGMGVISQVELDEGEQIDIDLITDRNMFFFSGKVIWKNKSNRCFDYGLQLTHYDVTTRHLYEEYLLKQKEIFINMMHKAR